MTSAPFITLAQRDDIPHTVYPVGDSVFIVNGDSLHLLELLPDNSVDLIVIDPPYFKVKDAPWDRQWDTAPGFLEWMRQLCKQFARILRPNGSIYVFASADMASRVEAVIAEFFNVLNHIVWIKGDKNGNGQHSKIDDDILRSFFTQTERIIFAEHYGADNMAKGVPGYEARCNEARGFVFEPLRAYLAGEVARAGLTTARVEEYLGTFMGRHYFSASQWELPTPRAYDKVRECLNTIGRKPAPAYDLYHPAGGLWEKYGLASDTATYMAAGYDYLRADYDYLSADYEALKAEFEQLRRPFSAKRERGPYTDVWPFLTVAGYAGKHPCEKPAELIRHILECSSKPGSVVLDCFLGSGVTGEQAKRMGRYFIGMEKDEKWVHTARARIGDSSAILDIPHAKPAVWNVRQMKPIGPAAQLSVFDLLPVDEV